VDRAALIVLAAGSGDRLGRQVPKAFVPLGGTPLLEHALTTAFGSLAVTEAVVAVPAGWEDQARELLDPLGPGEVIVGGDSRQASVQAALAAVSRDTPVILCHDAARPLAGQSLFSAVVGALEGWDGVVPLVPVTDTVKRVSGERVTGTEARSELGLAQTPQAFLAGVLRDAHARAERDGVELTDDAMALERSGYRVRAVDGEPGNFKITTPEDLARAEAVLAGHSHG
jgi:2-C-methyl-D-erythritol 4-phosphate cytidylyltransferase